MFFTKSLEQNLSNLSLLSPIEAEACQLPLRIYHQIHEWYGNRKSP